MRAAPAPDGDCRAHAGIGAKRPVDACRLRIQRVHESGVGADEHAAAADRGLSVCRVAVGKAERPFQRQLRARRPRSSPASAETACWPHRIPIRSSRPSRSGCSNDGPASHRFFISDASPVEAAPSGRPPTYTATTRRSNSDRPCAYGAIDPVGIDASTSSGVDGSARSDPWRRPFPCHGRQRSGSVNV